MKAGDAGEGHPEAEARQIAQGVLDQVRAGADFAELARKLSEDQGSAQSGGDLGCFPPGRMVPEFDDAAFALEPGQISELVKTSYGSHVIRLASQREASRSYPRPGEGAHPRQRRRARCGLGEQKAQAIAEALGKGQSLEVAASAGLSVQKSAPFAGATPPVLSSPSSWRATSS